MNKKDFWTEEEILQIPIEHDKYERKAGAILTNHSWKHSLATEICAFANSFGGVLVLGIKEDKKTGNVIIDGAETHYGREPLNEWLEKTIPELVFPYLQNFRILPVKASNNSQIPEGKTLWVIEIGESDLVPHQTNDDTRGYYHRVNSSSKPAHHIYIEGLRNVKRYPSYEIVRAWLDTFLHDLLLNLTETGNSLFDRNFVYDEKSPTKISIQESLISDYSKIIRHKNAEQFFKQFKFIKDLLRERERNLNEFLYAFRQLVSAIHESGELNNILYQEIPEQNITKPFDIYPPSIQDEEQNEDLSRVLNYADSDGKRFYLLCKIFGVPEYKSYPLPEKISGFIAYKKFCLSPFAGGNYWERQIPKEKNTRLSYFWERNFDFLAKVFSNQSVSTELSECERHLEKSYNKSWSVAHKLEEITDFLCNRSGVPYVSLSNERK